MLQPSMLCFIQLVKDRTNLHVWAHTVKKGLRHSRPQTRCHLPNSPWAGINKFFPAIEGLVSNIPAGDGNVANLLFTVHMCLVV